MRIATSEVFIPAMHPSWKAALDSTDVPVKIEAPVSARVVGFALPLSYRDLENGNRLGQRLQQVTAGGVNPDKIARVGLQVCTEAGAGLNDLTRLQHPEWHSGADLPIGGIAVAASSLEMWRALQSDSDAEKLFSAAQLGANLIDLTAGSIEALAPAAPTVHGICLLVRTVAGFAKICVSLKQDGPAA